MIFLFLAEAIQFIATNDRFQWDVVGRYLFAPAVLKGLLVSIELTVVCLVNGAILGTLVALARLSDFAPFRALSWLYTWVFRGLPPLVQLLIWYNLAYLVPQIRIGLPFFGSELASFDTNVVISAWTAAVIALSLHEGAYMAETIRAGLLSVDPGQRDAAKALGMSERRTLFRIVLPQALRFIIPPTGSQAIALLKGTSLVSAITLGDLLHSVQLIYDRTFQVVPMLVVACFWYLLVIAILSFFQMKLERYYGRGHRTLAVPS